MKNNFDVIGFDVDGVLTNYHKFCIKYGLKYFKVKNLEDIPNFNGYGIKEIFGCTSDEEKKFWYKYNFKYVLNAKPRSDVKRYINKLKKDGKKIVIISARVKTNEDNLMGLIQRNCLKFWLFKNKIKYDDISFCDYKKSEIEKPIIIREKNIDIYVEDQNENIETIKSETKVIKFVTESNLDKNFSDVDNADNFEMVYDTINNYEYNAPKITRVSLEEQKAMGSDELIEYNKKQKLNYQIRYFDKEKFRKGEKGCRMVLSKLNPLFDLAFEPKIIFVNKNKDIMNDDEGCIFAANHLHALDPLLLLSAFKNENFHLIAKSELEERKVSLIFKTIGAYFVNSNSKSSKEYSLEKSVQVLLNKGNTMIFPEAHRSKDGNLGKFKKGAVTVAQITGCPILPFAINKDYRLFNNELTVVVGEKFYVKEYEDLEEANLKLEEKIVELMEILEINKKIQKNSQINNQNNVGISRKG